MGIRGLWKILQPASQCRSFTELCITEGYLPTTMTPLFTVGVDASIWLVEAQHPFHGPVHSQSGENPEARVIFHRLARLYRAPVTAIFVFDGPSRPDLKRGKKVGTTPHWLTRKMQELVVAFGFQVRQAPGEAEAELAYLNYAGYIQAIITTDGDAFAFGGNTVIRFSDRTKPDDVEVYTGGNILSEEMGVKLDQDSIILIALLSGGDYDPVGLHGCGPEIALGLAHYGLGKSLLSAVRDGNQEDCRAFLAIWREDLRNTLRTDPLGHLGRRYPMLAAQVPDAFPDRQTVLLYAKPLTSRGNLSSAVEPAGYLDLHTLDMGKLADLCGASFGWNAAMVLKNFQSLLWEGMALRMLCHDSFPPRTTESIALQIEIRTHKFLVRSKKLLRYRIELSNTMFDNDLLNTAQFRLLHDQQTLPPVPWATSRYRMWVPAAVLKKALPDVVKTYNTFKPRNKSPSVRSASAEEIPTTAHPETIDLTQDEDDNDNDNDQATTSQPNSKFQGFIDLTVTDGASHSEAPFIDLTKTPDSDSEVCA